MAVQQHRLDEFQQLRTEAAQVRLRAIRSQIALALTFCNIAESDLELRQTEQSHRVVGKLQRLSATVRRHLNEPGYVPTDEVERVGTELERLEARIRTVEERQNRNC
jgi:hypothetical protein